jgi:NTE family protein
MRRKIGLALGGGGARGFAHLGILMALAENKIPVDYVSGTSMGAIMGAARALEMDLARLKVLLTCLDLNELLQVSQSTMRELEKAIGRGFIEYVRGSDLRTSEDFPESLARIYELFSLLTANKDFSDTHIPFAVVAADLETGERIVITEGKLYKAIAASAAIPGTFSPVTHQGRYLIDGGIVDKVPASVTIKMGANAVIAVDTGAPLRRSVKTTLDALLQSQRITSHALTALQMENAKRELDGHFILLRPNVGWINMLAFKHVEEAIEAGKREAYAHMPEIRHVCGLSK